MMMIHPIRARLPYINCVPANRAIALTMGPLNYGNGRDEDARNAGESNKAT